MPPVSPGGVPPNGAGPPPRRLTDTNPGAIPFEGDPGRRPPEPAGYPNGVRTASAAARFEGARSELRRQLREHKRVRAMALSLVVLVVLGAPMLYFGISFATRDPVLTSLDELDVPGWAAASPEDRIISGSRWCFIDCRFRERVLVSERGPEETTAIYLAALQDAGWSRWQVEGCPLVDVDGDYSCWTRDEYTLDLWVHPPECAYDPLNQRPDIAAPGAEESPSPGDEAAPTASPPPPDCTGSIVEIKMQNRVADERGLSGEIPLPPATPTVPPSGTPLVSPTAPAG